MGVSTEGEGTTGGCTGVCRRAQWSCIRNVQELMSVLWEVLCC